MIKISAFAAIFLAAPVGAQEKLFDFKGISNIEVRNGITVELVQGDEFSIVGTAQSGDVSQFRLQKYGDWLAVNRNTRWFIFPYARQDELTLTVTLPNTRALKAYGTASITATGFSGNRIRAEALEGGTVTLNDFDTDETSLYATENGNLTISGTCDALYAEAIDSATINAGAFNCETAEVETKTAGVISISETTQIVEDLGETAQ